MISFKKGLIIISSLGLLTVGCENKKTSSSPAKKEQSQTKSEANLSTPEKIKKYKALYEAASDSCKVTVDSNDMMRFQQNGKNINELKLPLDCGKFYIRLRHTGKLPAQVMGHNLVIAKTSDTPSLVQTCLAAGRASDYLPKNDSKVIAQSNTIVGGGDKDVKEDYMEVDTSKFDKKGDYTFFCSYPGHFAIMKGKITF